MLIAPGCPNAYVAFKCLDPDGRRIEVYWEPLRAA